jgi:hypothetical protein
VGVSQVCDIRSDAVMFKKRRGIKVPYNKQGLIYFTCANIADMPEEIQIKIVDLCKEVGNEHSGVLYEVMTNSSKSICALAMDYHISETQLYHYRKKFYEAW